MVISSLPSLSSHRVTEELNHEIGNCEETMPNYSYTLFKLKNNNEKFVVDPTVTPRVFSEGNPSSCTFVIVPGSVAIAYRSHHRR
jgi:hypothetical protein